MHKKRMMLTAALSASVLLAACGSDSDSSSSTAAPASEPAGTSAAGEAVNLKGVCPDKVVVQTDWYPESEHGATYELMGDDFKASKDSVSVTGSLVFNGQPTGVQLEIRAGGPALGDQTVVSQMYRDDDILLGYVSTDEGIKYSKDQPTVAVVAPQDKSPQIILWDKAKHPDAKTIADIAKEVDTITVFAGATYIDYLVSAGIVPKEKVDLNYKGDKILVTKGDTVAHQGFATAEPYQYAHLDTGAIDVGYQLIYDTGWQLYPESLAVRKNKLDDTATTDCLKALVPMFQQAQIDYAADPARADNIIIETNKVYDTFWQYDQGAAAESLKQQIALGILSNGSNDTLGDFDEARVTDLLAKAIPVFQSQNVDVDPALKPADIVTNDYIDTSISFTG